MPAQALSRSNSWSLTSLVRSSSFGGEAHKTTDAADELLDMLESGYARESITHECLTPREPVEMNEERSRSHQYFSFKRIGKKTMELHTDNGHGNKEDRFLLSARKVGTTFYISPYAFSADLDDNEIKQMRRCAVLKKVPYGANGFCYRLLLDGCEGCNRDQIYEGVCEEGSENKLLADIWHSMTNIDGADTIMRSIRITLPAQAKGGVRAKWETGSNCSSGSDDETTPTEPVSLVTKMPVWNSRTGNMTQKFHGNRVKRSSAKNIILTRDRMEKRANQTTAMQFGKRGKSEYVLDHSSPLSTLQAFAVGLSMCAWIGDGEN